MGYSFTGRNARQTPLAHWVSVDTTLTEAEHSQLQVNRQRAAAVANTGVRVCVCVRAMSLHLTERAMVAAHDADDAMNN